MALKPITQKQFLVLIDQLKETYWSKATAPKETREAADYNDGQTGNTKKALGFVSRDNITLSKAFDPVADKVITTWYDGIKKNGTPAEGFSISIQPVQNNLETTTISGVTITLTGCQVVSFKLPEIDRMGNGVAMLELEVCYDNLSFQTFGLAT